MSEDTPVSRTEFLDLTDRKAFLEALRHRRTTVAIRVQRVRDATKTKLGVINKRLERIDKQLAKIDDLLIKAETAMDAVWE